MGKVLSNKDITFEDMNSKNDMTFDIVIEKLILQVIVNEKMKYGLFIRLTLILAIKQLSLNVFILMEMIFWHTSNKYPIKC